MTLQTKLSLQKTELQESIQLNEATLAANAQELSHLQTEIQSVQSQLQTTLQPQYEDAKDTLRQMTNERDEARKKMDGLYEKQGRARHFRSSTDRDQYLTTQIEEVTQAMAEKDAFRSEQQDALANLRRTHQTAADSLKTKTAEITKKAITMERLQTHLEQTKTQRHDMAESRKSQWAEYDELSAQISEARDTARGAQSALRKVTPRATNMGLEALRRIVKEEGFSHDKEYFGPVMENFQLVDGSKFRTAVEVAAQNALFHVIVDTDSTAAKLMKRLEREKLGRVTFLPLNQLRDEGPGGIKYPESSDVTPILRRCLRYDSKVHKAMQHVFGKKLLARSVDVASTWSAQCDMDAITLEGDLCSRKGALTGGYVDHAKR